MFGWSQHKPVMNNFTIYSRPLARSCRLKLSLPTVCLFSLGNYLKTRKYNTTTTQPPLAFAFDIDGVLIRGNDVLPAARRALKVLEGNNLFGKKIPYILLTNGGGVSEDERCTKLSNQLGVPISRNQYIQAHTILRKFSHKYSNKSVLVLGGRLNQVREVAKGYGFKNVFTTLDILAWNPLIWPFHTLSEAERNEVKTIDFSNTPLSAIFVFHDPRNWAADIQIACDVIQSNGIVGGPHIPINQQQNPVELVFCNPDLIWKSDFNLPRLGQGAFKVAFQAVFRALTGNEYPYVQFGKPTRATYEFAEQVLKTQIEELYGNIKIPPNIYMVGDNPESDIAGANAVRWSSILVNTGVFDPAQGLPNHSPTYFAQDVEEAVIWAVTREYRIAEAKV